MISIRVEKRQIGYIKWLLECHDGMATPTTRPGSDDVLDLLVAPDFTREFDVFLEDLESELQVERIPLPSIPPLQGPK